MTSTGRRLYLGRSKYGMHLLANSANPMRVMSEPATGLYLARPVLIMFVFATR